jgi:heme exporter protein A
MTQDAESAETTGSVVRAAGLAKELDDRQVLQSIDLEVPAGRFVALLGANGAGKSTLLNIVAGLTRPTAGALCLFGQTVVRRRLGALQRRIGMIGHQPMLYRDLSIQENLLLFGRLYDVPQPARRAAELLARVGLAERAHDPVGTFSRGMVQRAAIARAMMHDPDLLLADEPFSGLDLRSVDALRQLLGELHAGGKTVVLASHDVPGCLELAQQIVVLRRGRIVMNNPVAGLEPNAVITEVTA